MTKTGVLTQYMVGESPYSSYIVGNSLKDIRKKVKKRKLNEQIETMIQDINTIPDFDTINNLEFIQRLPQIIHTACFLSYIALNAETISVHDVLGDEGVLHELTHLMTGSIPVTDESVRSIRDQLTLLKKHAIGL